MDVGILRVHESGSGGFGSSPMFQVTMRVMDEVADFFAGVAFSPYTKRVHRAIKSAMHLMGIYRVRYDRRNMNRVRCKELVR